MLCRPRTTPSTETAGELRPGQCPSPGDAAPVSKTGQSGGKTPNKSGFWCCYKHWDIRWEHSGCDSREGEGRAHLPKSQLRDRDWGLSTGTKILLSHMGGRLREPRWEQAEGEKDFKARRLRQPRLKARNAFWIKERDCFHLSSYTNNPRGKWRGKRHRQREALSAGMSSSHQARIRPPGDSRRLRFPE